MGKVESGFVHESKKQRQRKEPNQSRIKKSHTLTLAKKRGRRIYLVWAPPPAPLCGSDPRRHLTARGTDRSRARCQDAGGARASSGTVAKPLNGGALAQWRRRSPARGSAAAPPLFPGLHGRRRSRGREKGRKGKYKAAERGGVRRQLTGAGAAAFSGRLMAGAVAMRGDRKGRGSK